MVNNLRSHAVGKQLLQINLKPILTTAWQAVLYKVKRFATQMPCFRYQIYKV